MICGELSSGEIATLIRTSRLFRHTFEAILYLLHDSSAVAWAVDGACPDKPATRRNAISIPDKVKWFTSMKSRSLDFTYGSLDLSNGQYPYQNLCRIEVYPSVLQAASAVAFQVLPFSSSSTPRSIAPSSLTPLHLAAWEGLDEVVVWLLSNGARIGVSSTEERRMPPFMVAVISDNISTAALLLASGASLTFLADDEEKQHKERWEGNEVDVSFKLIIIHYACALGSGNMAKQLLDIGYIQQDPTDLLTCYAEYGVRDAPTVVKMLLSLEAKASDRLFLRFLETFKWQSALKLLQSTLYRVEMTLYQANDLF